jgi:hypothetical protein
MAMPTTDEFLSKLYRVKRDCLEMIAAAEARGDGKEARAFQESLAEMNALIRQKGGNLDA